MAEYGVTSSAGLPSGEEAALLGDRAPRLVPRPDRPPGIGGSDAAAACGLDRYRSRIALWLEKTGRLERPEPGEWAHWGDVLAPVVADELERCTGLQTLPAPADVTLRGPRAFMFGHPDGYVARVVDDAREPYRERGVLELKTAGHFQGAYWDDGKTPVAYELQCLHYLAVTGLPFAVIACLIGGQRFEWRLIERDEEAITLLIEREEDFWSYVLSDTQPAPDAIDYGSGTTDELLRVLYPSAREGASVTLTEADGRLLKERRSLIRSLKSTEEEIAAIDHKLKFRMGDAERATLNGETVLRWSTVHRKAYSVAEKSYRRFVVV